jgi:predicted acetyltransferase
MFSRNSVWWENREIADPEERRDGAGPKRWVAYERDGSIEGYAVYRHKPGFEAGATSAELRVLEALGTSPEALRDLWAYLLAVDWVATVKAFLLPPDHALFLLLSTPRRMRYRMGDGIWVRLVDVGAALSGRSYSGEGSIVFEVEDGFCPWNEGRWKLAGGRAERSKDATELSLPVQSLGSALLGGVSFAALRRAGRVVELKAGAIERADALFRWDRHPWCPEIF